MAFREVQDSDCYCDEPAGKDLTKKIVDLLNEPDNTEAIRQVLISDKKLLMPATFMLLPFTKKGDFHGSDMGGTALGKDQIDAHNITHGILTLVRDNTAKNAGIHFENLEKITKEIIDMVDKAADCELKRLIEGNIKSQQADNSKSPRR